MTRRKTHTPLLVHLNGRHVGRLGKRPDGAIEFSYAPSWIEWEHSIPVSLSLPIREETYRGAVVSAVFENLLPDSDAIRRHIAERVGASGQDAFSLLSQIGRDCVGALQFTPEGREGTQDSGTINGEVVTEDEIEALLNNLARAPLGINRDDDFRISVAGAQEKTALLRYNDQWLKPSGTTPTTHIFKPTIGEVNGVDFEESVANEFYCLKLMQAFGLPVADATMETFGNTKALVVERFDRRWTKDGKLLRLPQEDFCQALSIPPTVKYQNQGGPGLADILKLLKGADAPLEEQSKILKAQMIFWLIGATDGHAKNFSIFLYPGGRFQLTPFYDVMTAQPSFDNHEIKHSQMKLAMSLGKSNHYRFDKIQLRHFIETAKIADVPLSLLKTVLSEIQSVALFIRATMESLLPNDFPEDIHHSIMQALEARLATLDNDIKSGSVRS